VDLTPGATKLLAYWGNIQSAVAARASTAELWATVRDAAAADNFDISPANAVDMGQLRSLAAGNRNASAAFNAASENQSLDSSMIGSELYTPNESNPAAERLYLVRFQQTVLEDEAETTIWRTDMFRGLLPPTKSDLMAQLDNDAQNLADEYNQTHIGIGDVAISLG
jgi:hypothetical protein